MNECRILVGKLKFEWIGMNLMGGKSKCWKIVISLLANMIVVDCRHTRTLCTSARLDLSERTRTTHKVGRCQQITCSGWPGSAARISVTMQAILGGGFAHYVQASDGITPHVRTQPLLYTYVELTYPMEQNSSWEANRFSVKKFPAFYGNRWFITIVISTLILNQSGPAYASTSHFLWRSIVILSFHIRPGLPSGHFSGFRTRTLYTPLLFPIRATCPTHLILLDLITRSILGENYKSLNLLIM
jgi:hypothetical protein